MKKNGQNSSLSPACALFERFGSRWALLVLLTLQEHEVLRFSELTRSVPGGISERMLAATVRDLEQAGLVARTLYPEVPPRVEYRLTPKGESLMPLLRQLLEWAEKNG
ncbi:helix-turn-helix domain-containing protein [uncultured Alistipes sp.]|uniref:winged helix-turn-helix transcriptional regulator n=1 Tax=uncultured Alistipes sp. TaxID=538949 RepID=UPI00272D71A9|nr:helix-turn-helix domain-containing protein [uncultured Alistipes sp.]